VTVLVAMTGATGYVGRAALASIASRGDSRIRVLSRDVDAVELADEVIRGSILDGAVCERLVSGADVVIHAAGLVRSRDAVALRDVNVAGTERLVTIALGQGVKRFVYVSSTGVYGHPGRRVDESSPRRPVGPYERSKAAAEEIVLKAAAMTVVVQPSNIIGLRHPLRPLRRFLETIQKGRPVIHAGSWTNYVGVADVARVIAEAAKAEGVPRVLIVNAPMPLGELARVAGEVIARPPRVAGLPAWLGRALSPPLQALTGPIPSLDRLHALVDQTRFCTSHETWVRDRGLMPTLAGPLAEIAEEYGLR
jgi:nucleoside-diphosphate-sugar epimerase